MSAPPRPDFEPLEGTRQTVPNNRSNGLHPISGGTRITVPPTQYQYKPLPYAAALAPHASRVRAASATTAMQLPFLDSAAPTSKIPADSSSRVGARLSRVDCEEEHMPLIDTSKRDRIRELNDEFRTNIVSKLGRTVLTAGVTSLPDDVRTAVIRKTATFDAFDEDNDPHGEHDFGAFNLAGQRFFWKIDYYDESMERGSEDPADEAKTKRVLTIMLAEEY